MSSSSQTLPRAAVLGLLALLASALLAACSGGDDDAATATATASPTAAAAATATATPAATPPSGTDTPTATATPSPEPPASLEVDLEPDAERAFGHLRVLAEEIGIRSAATAAEREAAAYIAEQFEAAGYVVAIEEFEASFNNDTSTLFVDGEGEPIAALALSGSRQGETTARLAFAGLGDAEAIAAVDAGGAIVLLDRGVLTFVSKARNAEAAGAAAVVIVNNAPGPLRGALGDGSGISIPIIGVPEELGPALRALAEDGATVTVRSEFGPGPWTSQNVVGRPQGGECRAYLGAHYDSVPQGPGANDNASGTALLIELAHTNRVEGLCVVAFGAEEFGLFGSRAFVREHDVSGADFMLNFDMVARIGGPRFVAGDAALADLASSIAADLGHEIPRGAFPANSSSDHTSFSQVGVPAITVHSGDADFIHTAQDAIDAVFVEDLAVFLEVSTELLRTLLEG